MERERLLEWTRRHKSAQALALRARIVLAAAEGHTNRAVAHQLRITGQTVGKWRRRFLGLRLEGLLDEPRPGAPRQIGDQQVEAVIAKTLHERPEGATHWSSRLMAEASGLSQTAVVRIWYLALLWSAAASYRDLQALHRPTVYRESQGYRRSLSESADQSHGVVRR